MDRHLATGRAAAAAGSTGGSSRSHFASRDPMLIKGGCHCGKISFSLDWPGDRPEIPARACGCSFCVKHGGVWTSKRGATLDVRVHDGKAAATYAFGTGTASFHVCSRCGVVPFVSSEIADRLYAVVNVNTFEGVVRRCCSERARISRARTWSRGSRGGRATGSTMSVSRKIRPRSAMRGGSVWNATV